MRDADRFWREQFNGKEEPPTYELGDPFLPRSIVAREKMIASLADREPTLETLGMKESDLPANFSQMSDAELEMMGANITLYTPEQATQLLREISSRRKFT